MLDFSAGQISFEARQLALQAGPFLALALALALTAAGAGAAPKSARRAPKP